MIESDDSTPPSLTKKVNPDYPEAARQEHMNGAALFQAIIEPTGRIEEVCLVAASTETHGFAEAGTAAIRHWTYAPATREGVPLRTLVTVAIEWRIP